MPIHGSDSLMGVAIAGSMVFIVVRSRFFACDKDDPAGAMHPGSEHEGVIHQKPEMRCARCARAIRSGVRDATVLGDEFVAMRHPPGARAK